MHIMYTKHIILRVLLYYVIMLSYVMLYYVTL